MEKDGEISKKDLIEKTKLSEEKLDLFLADNLLFKKDGDQVLRNKNLTFKLLKIITDKELDIKILDLRK